MSKVIIVDYGDIKFHEHYCPACKMLHQIAVEKPYWNNAQWSFNGDMEKPTFNPSINVLPNSPEHRCHYFIHDGIIKLL